MYPLLFVIEIQASYACAGLETVTADFGHVRGLPQTSGHKRADDPDAGVIYFYIYLQLCYNAN